jgi:hypothetical protein
MWITNRHYCETVTVADLKTGDLYALPGAQYMTRVSGFEGRADDAKRRVLSGHSSHTLANGQVVYRALKARDGLLIHERLVGYLMP